MEVTHYSRIAVHLKRAVARGQLMPGERFPSVRDLARVHGVSPPTAERALRELEAAGLAVARPRSGFFVANPSLQSTKLQPKRDHGSPSTPRPITLAGEVHALFSLARSQDVLTLGSATPCPDWLPFADLSRSTTAALRRLGPQAALYSVPPGRPDLRKQIARRALRWGGSIDAERLIVTAGATQAIQLALQVTTRPGDTVALESPCYFGMLMLLKSRGLKVVEIATSPTDGMDLERLAQALDRYKVAAVIATPTANNPMGFTMSPTAKRRLVQLVTQKEVPLIEDDIYGDITTSRLRPAPCKAYDSQGMVLYCSSVSKTLAPGWRIGWLEAGRYAEPAIMARVESSLAGSQLLEASVAQVMASGDYDRHLRRFAARAESSVRAICTRIAATWPEGTRLSPPSAGFLVWVELAPTVDTKILLAQGISEGFSIGPGAMFSADGSRFGNCLRLNGAMPATPQLLRVIDRIGEYAGRMSRP